MTTSGWWLVLKAVVAIVPAIVFMVRDGRIKEATQEEVFNEMLALSKERVDRAANVWDDPASDGLPNDEYDRANRGPDIG